MRGCGLADHDEARKNGEITSCADHADEDDHSAGWIRAEVCAEEIGHGCKHGEEENPKQHRTPAAETAKYAPVR